MLTGPGVSWDRLYEAGGLSLALAIVVSGMSCQSSGQMGSALSGPGVPQEAAVVCAQQQPGLHGDDQSWSERSEKRWVFREDFQADCLTVGHGFLLQGQARSVRVSCATTGCPQEDAMHLSFLLVKWWCLHPRKSLNFRLLCSRGSSEACEIGVLF